MDVFLENFDIFMYRDRKTSKHKNWSQNLAARFLYWYAFIVMSYIFLPMSTTFLSFLFDTFLMWSSFCTFLETEFKEFFSIRYLWIKMKIFDTKTARKIKDIKNATPVSISRFLETLLDKIRSNSLRSLEKHFVYVSRNLNRKKANFFKSATKGSWKRNFHGGRLLLVEELTRF